MKERNPHNRSAGRLIVVLILVAVLAPAAGLALAATGPASVAPGAVRDFNLFDPSRGWVWTTGHLYRTESGGSTWVEITPPTVVEQPIQAVHFSDPKDGWVLLASAGDAGTPGFSLARSHDAGSNWETRELHLFEGDDPASVSEAVHLFALDSAHAWFVVQQATGRNFSAGALFRTSDGGATWKRLSVPIGDGVYFADANVGWTAGGAAGDELYRTTDAGSTWTRQAPLATSEETVATSYRSPVLDGDGKGTLIAVEELSDSLLLHLFDTTDGGETWQLLTSATLGAPSVGAEDVVVAYAGASFLASPGNGKVVQVTRDEVPSSLPGAPRAIDRLLMGGPKAGWATSSAGRCAAEGCLSETAFLRTADGGVSWKALELPGGEGGTRSLLPAPATAVRAYGARTSLMQGQGFDKCEIPSLSQLQHWMDSGPYRAVNLYYGGNSRACANRPLTASFLQQAAAQGWRFIPTWVGPQAPCTSYSHKFSQDPATAYGEGAAEANAALATAKTLGLALPDGSGTAIYYDLEAYSTGNAACVAAARSFASGWTSIIQASGSAAGFYATGPVLGTFASLPEKMDVIWPASWIFPSYNSGASVWNVYGLSNTLWSQHQRVRQYAGGHNESWGNISLNIDSNVIDGVVASLSGPMVSVALAGLAGENGWYRSAVKATLTAPSSGGASLPLQVRLDGGEWSDYGGPVNVIAQGVHTLGYRVQDSSGEWQSEQSIQVKVDSRPPGNPTAVQPGCTAAHAKWQNSCSDPAFTWSSVVDSVSGIAGYQVYWGNDPAGASGPAVGTAGYDPGVVGDGAQWLRVRTKDNAGNLSNWVTLFELRYDGTSPSGTVAIEAGDSATPKTFVRVATTASDLGSGVAEVRFRNPGGAWSGWQPHAARGWWLLSAAPGTEARVEVQYRDRAGNLSPVISDAIVLNLNPSSPASPGYRLAKSTTGLAGGSHSSANHRLSGTAGQASPVSPLSSPSYRVLGGFWGASRGPLLYLPLLARAM